tara:strand:- start:1654 stop:3462 length:1809 start_codon:yes stop_codon:yes gene_type:complete
MLTEQGAMDSGIGSLMENVVGDIDMETAQGAPTAMGEGVGSLMMAQADTGVGQEPPVNFNYGGPVQRFNGKNGISEVRKAAKERSALLSEMIGLDKQAALDQEALDSLRNTTKAQTWFDIAQAGLNLAAGDPSKSFAENFAISAAPVAANLSARGGAFAKEERDLDKLRRAQAQKIKLSAFETESARLSAQAARKEKRGYEKELAKEKRGYEKELTKDERGYEKELTKEKRDYEKEQAEKEQESKLAVAIAKKGDPEKYWYGHRKFGWKRLTKEEAAADPENIIPGLVAKVGTGVPKPRTLLNDSLTSREFLRAEVTPVNVSIATDVIFNASSKKRDTLTIGIQTDDSSMPERKRQEDDHRFVVAAREILDKAELEDAGIFVNEKVPKNTLEKELVSEDHIKKLVNQLSAADIRRLVYESMPQKLSGMARKFAGTLFPFGTVGETNEKNRNMISVLDHVWRGHIYQSLRKLGIEEREKMVSVFKGLWPNLQKTPSSAANYIEDNLLPTLGYHVEKYKARVKNNRENNRDRPEDTITYNNLIALQKPWLEWMEEHRNQNQSMETKRDKVRNAIKKAQKNSGRGRGYVSEDREKNLLINRGRPQ